MILNRGTICSTSTTLPDKVTAVDSSFIFILPTTGVVAPKSIDYDYNTDTKWPETGWQPEIFLSPIKLYLHYHHHIQHHLIVPSTFHKVRMIFSRHHVPTHKSICIKVRMIVSKQFVVKPQAMHTLHASFLVPVFLMELHWIGNVNTWDTKGRPTAKYTGLLGTF